MSVYERKLRWNSIMFDLRSRQGFLKLLAWARLTAWGIIGLRYVMFGSIHASSWGAAAWVIYFFFSLGAIFAVYFEPRFQRLDILGNHALIILFDTLMINIFIIQAANHDTELFLLLLLPLIITAHFLARDKAIWFSIVVLGSYIITLSAYSLLLEKDFPLLTAIGLSILRGLFLGGATIIYRIQNNFPHQGEVRITSPNRVKNRIETLLKKFHNSVNYDTISVMLIYREHLQIIACQGFAKPDDIYQIEFPINDPHYPNFKVIKQKSICLEDPRRFQSFRDARYFASDIRTWLGVPLVSPDTGECYGMVSIDSNRREAFSARDVQRAGWFAATLSTVVLGAQLGPAALTQANKRENTNSLLKYWSSLLKPKNGPWEDDLQAARALADFGKTLFHVEDCSVFFLKQANDTRTKPERIMHMVASSAVPEDFFKRHESKVTGKPGDGLTGRAVFLNRNINLGGKDIECSTYRTGFTGHLDFLDSKRSRQILIAPIRDSKRRPQGAIKLENRSDQASDTPFSPMEVHLFDIYAAMAGLIFENIRQKHFIDHQMENVHDVRGIMHLSGIEPIDELLAQDGGDSPIQVEREKLMQIRHLIDYSKGVLDGVLSQSTGKFTLENEGLMPAIQSYVDRLGATMPTLKKVCELIKFEGGHTRDELPLRVRIAFFNIAREAVSNIVRHSQIEQIKNGHATIKFFCEESTYHLLIEDNGQGFDLKSVNMDRQSYGLHDMYFQKDSILHMCRQASLEIKPRRDFGTKIHLVATI